MGKVSGAFTVMGALCVVGIAWHFRPVAAPVTDPPLPIAIEPAPAVAPPATRANLPTATSADAASAPASAVAKPVQARPCGAEALVQGTTSDDAAWQALERHAEPMIELWKQRLLEATNPQKRAVGLMVADGDRRSELAALALSTRDAAVFGLAVHACKRDAGKPGSGPCAAADPQLWAALDPHHAEPWLHLAGLAWERGDEAATDAALRRAAGLEFGRLSERVLLSAPVETMPAEADLPQQAAIWGIATGINAAQWLPGIGALWKHCGAKALQAPGRRALCESLADLLAYRSTTLIDRNLGARIGKDLGWSADRLAAIEGDIREAVQAAQRAVERPQHECDQMRQIVVQAAQVAEHGELAALRAQRAQSPR